MGFIETILSDLGENTKYYHAIVKVLRQQNYDTAIQDKEIDLIRQMYSPAGLIIQERVSQASGGLAAVAGAALPPGAKNGWRWPLAHMSLLDRFHARGAGGGHRIHEGLDLAALSGTPVFAARDGKIVAMAQNTPPYGGYGNIVVIAHGGGLDSRYAHLRNFIMGMRVGTEVKAGDQIGFSGATGGSAGRPITGPHLHFEIRSNNIALNPTDFIKF